MVYGFSISCGPGSCGVFLFKQPLFNMTKVIIALLAISLIISIGSRYTGREKLIHHWFKKDTTYIPHHYFNAVRFREKGGIELLDTAIVTFTHAEDSVCIVKEKFNPVQFYYDATNSALVSSGGRIFPLPKGNANQQFIPTRSKFPGDTLPRISGDTVFLPTP